MEVRGVAWEHMIQHIDVDPTEPGCGTSNSIWLWPDQDIHEG